MTAQEFRGNLWEFDGRNFPGVPIYMQILSVSGFECPNMPFQSWIASQRAVVGNRI